VSYNGARAAPMVGTRHQHEHVPALNHYLEHTS